MASKEQVFDILPREGSEPISRATLEERLGEKFTSIATQMKRWIKDGLIIEDGDQHYSLTQKGVEDLKNKVVEMEIGPELKTTEESLGSTEYQVFIRKGKLTGVTPLALIQQTADHVWEGGEYKDLVWVAQAMMEMSIRADLRSRWLNSWRSYLKQGIPANLPVGFTGDTKKESESTGSVVAGKRDYILNEDDTPINVGVGNGDLDYKDALELSKIKLARRTSTGIRHDNGEVSKIDEITKLFSLFREFMGGQTAGKSYVVRPADNGQGHVVEELDLTKPMVIPPNAQPPAQKSYYVGPDGTIEDVPPGKPVVIRMGTVNSGTAQPADRYLVDKQSGQVQKLAPGEPIVITIRPEGSQGSGLMGTPIQVLDKDGKPMVLDIASFFRLEEHREKMKRDDESHQTKMEIAKGFKDLIKQAGSALSHMGAEEGK